MQGYWSQMQGYWSHLYRATVSFCVVKYDTIITCDLITTHTTLISCTCNNAEMIIGDSFVVILIIS